MGDSTDASQAPPPPSSTGIALSKLPVIRACLFDMDGLLIDSEDLYTVCTNAVLHEYGRPSLPWNIKAQLQGRPGPEAGKILADWAQLPITREEWLAKTQALQRKWFPSTKPLPGVVELLKRLGSTNGEVKMALATSSHAGNFKLKTDHLEQLFSVFPQENRVLGDDKRIPPGRGKPAPDIYLLALQTVNDRLAAEGQALIKPAECLVFEDSVPGVEAGRRAGMQVVWCPHPELLKEYAGREDMVLAGLMGEHKEDEDGPQEEVVSHDGRTRRKGAPGEIGDGWSTLLPTLEGFPYEKFGINVVK